MRPWVWRFRGLGVQGFSVESFGIRLRRLRGLVLKLGFSLVGVQVGMFPLL